MAGDVTNLPTASSVFTKPSSQWVIFDANMTQKRQRSKSSLDGALAFCCCKVLLHHLLWSLVLEVTVANTRDNSGTEVAFKVNTGGKRDVILCEAHVTHVYSHLEHPFVLSVNVSQGPTSSCVVVYMNLLPFRPFPLHL